jgi:hypothetical protein
MRTQWAVLVVQLAFPVPPGNKLRIQLPREAKQVGELLVRRKAYLAKAVSGDAA